MFLLGQPQTPADHGPIRAQIHLGQLPDSFLFDTGLVHDVRPAGFLDQRPVGLETGRAPLQELVIDGLGVGLGALEHHLRHPAQQRQVATDAGLNVHRSDLGGVKGRHRHDLVRHDRAAAGRLDQRVDVHDLRATAVRLGE